MLIQISVRFGDIESCISLLEWHGLGSEKERGKERNRIRNEMSLGLNGTRAQRRWREKPEIRFDK